MNQYLTESSTGENYIKDGFRRDDPRIDKILKENRNAAKERRKLKLSLMKIGTTALQ
ncbi:hypothetical protein UFOVP745_27 [uncultured Caudovirales phage]|uniref:Uncharacterized protein n=1 Tax=uncultured Caudovirales phage TaxID=2100421 RepID=A0A6J7X7H2_9CAUD|nr:hypothetical protein UFOVP745_27 [uncultured Caudovirales phage]